MLNRSPIVLISDLYGYYTIGPDARSLLLLETFHVPKRILEEGLRAFWRAPIHRAWAGTLEPGSFAVGRMLREFYGIENVSRFDRRTRRKELRHKLAAPHAAASRALSSLLRRGFLERAGRHCWRLSAQGLKAAHQLCPTLKKPTRAQMIREIKAGFLIRKA